MTTKFRRHAPASSALNYAETWYVNALHPPPTGSTINYLLQDVCGLLKVLCFGQPAKVSKVPGSKDVWVPQ